MKILIGLLSLLLVQQAFAKVFITEVSHQGHQNQFEVASFAINTRGAVMDLRVVNKQSGMTSTYQLSHENLKYINVSPVELGRLLADHLYEENSDLQLLIKNSGPHRGFYLSEVSF